MYGAPPRCIEATYSVAEPHCTETFCSLTKPRLADLQLIKDRPWFALYRPEEFVSGIKELLMSKWEPFLFRVFRLGKPIQESRRADSNRLPLLQLRVCLRTF
jgi:hypothetical protein